MSDETDITPSRRRPRVALPFGRERRRRAAGRVGGPPRLRKLRLLLILTGLGALAVVSTIFGMMMAVASDLPQLENRAVYRLSANSFLYDDHWRPIGLFAPPNNVVIDTESEISTSMKDAIVSVEDRRFFTSSGIDFRGIGRAFLADLTGGARQGASTIPQQFVKNALAEQSNRTIFEKLREAALAYHLTRKWSKEKILTEYLNSIYFGNGAYGVESAARVYFGKVHGYDATRPQASASATGTSGSSATGTSGSSTGTSGSSTQGSSTTAASPTGTSGASVTAPAQVGCGDGKTATGQVRPKCASVLAPWEAALLAGMVASPSAFNPIINPLTARDRRNLVLRDMLQQGYITRTQYEQGINAPLPTAANIQQPAEPTAAPYFTSWLRPQILAALGHGVSPAVAEYRAYFGGLKIRTTLDLELQQAAEQAVSAELPTGSGLPSASLVAIDNRTGEVRAMVGGPILNGQEDYRNHPFNVATEGFRQPGSSFKPFTLAAALESGQYAPDSIITSAPQDFIVPNSGGKEHFIVHNFGNAYSGSITLRAATAVSDNSVYAQVGIHVGTRRIAALAHRMGIRSPISTNYAMILGGLKIGVTPLEMAHAYETFATGGLRVFNPLLGQPDQGATGIAEIQCAARVCGHNTDLVDHPTYERVLPPAVAQTVHDILTGVVQFGTGTSASISGVDVAGKTGTTTNYADAWFVGWTPQMTTAVWVGYPDKLIPMATSFNGAPVEGGTYPAIIWHGFMTQALAILASEQPHKTNGPTSTQTTGSSGNSGSQSTSATTGASGAGASSTPTTTPRATGTSGAARNGGGAAGNSGAPAGGTPGGGGAGAGGTPGGGGSPGGGGGSPGGGAGSGGGGGTSTGGGSGGAGSGGAGLGGG